MTIINPIDPITFDPQQYSMGDKSSIPTLGVNSTFTVKGGRVEVAIFDTNNNILSYNPNAKFSAIENASGANLENANTLLVYPKDEVESLEFSQGKFFVVYNFINNELDSSFNQRFRIKEISANRKEIRLTAGFLSEEELEFKVNEFYPPTGNPAAYPDFYLNFGSGNLVIANNILFDGTGDQYSILVKLYKPLPSFVEVNGNTNPWVCTLQRETTGYSVEFEQEVLPVKTTIDLKGPNFSLDLNNQVHTSTQLASFSDINLTSGLDSSSYSSSYYQLQSLLNNKGIEVNIDYTDFNNFIHFSSAEERVKGFFYKVGLIESFSLDLTAENSYNPENSITKGKIENIIANFDGFEHWMYFTSSSKSFLTSSFPTPYPKKSLNGLPPFTFALTSSTLATNWYENAIYSSSEYDRENQDALINTIPSFIIEDSDNEKYLRFVKMIGQHFDTLFTYAQDINNRYNADNRLDFGISKDLVGEAIKSMGINLYTGNFTGANILSTLIGIEGSGADVNFLPTLEDGTPSSTITNYITASDFPTPIEDVNREIYKRIYHNLPLLLKQKGSIAGVRTLVNCFGIPKEILDVKEFDTRYVASTQNLPNVGESGSINFTTKSISLPPDFNGYIPQELLSPVVRVQQHYLQDEVYDRDLHYTEIGFSPQGYIDENNHSSFNPLNNFPDFNDFYFNTGSYYSSNFITGPQASGQDVTWDTSAYIRYIKFFDTSLFQMLKDFTPVRNSTATGVIIKPTIKERNKQRPAQLTYSNRTYNTTVNTEYYKWESSSFEQRAIGDYDKRNVTEQIAGTGGSFNNLNRYYFSSSDADWKSQDLALFSTGVLQIQSESLYTRMGYAQQTQIVSSSNINHIKYYDKQEEFYNGEFRQLGQRNINYLNKEYRDEGTDTGLFTYDNNPKNPYKKPANVTHSLSTMVVYNSVEEIIDAGGAFVGGEKLVITNITGSDVYNLLIKTSDGDPSEDTVMANGNIFNWQPEGGGQGYSFAVSNPYIVSSGYVGFGVLEPNSLGYQTLLDQTSIDYLAPFNPEAVNTKPGPWAYNDYNPLINNSFDPQAGLVNYNGIRKSTLFQDVDYSPSASSSLNPINVDLLIIGSASKAAVQDSNYSSRWWTNSRYEGNKISSPDFNHQILRTVKNTRALFTTESLGFDPDIPQSVQPAQDPGLPAND